jgi:hypothetical protein
MRNNNIDFSFINEFSKWIKEEKVNKDFNIKKNQRVQLGLLLNVSAFDRKL